MFVNEAKTRRVDNTIFYYEMASQNVGAISIVRQEILCPKCLEKECDCYRLQDVVWSTWIK